jgi:hypothetical protein
VTVLATVTAVAALICSGMAVLVGVLTFGVTRRGRLALAVFLDLLLAAGLLRLSGSPTWPGLLTAAALVAIRRLVGSGLRRSRRARAG